MGRHESNKSSPGRQKERRKIKLANKKLPSRRGWWVSSQAEPDFNQALEDGNVVAQDEMSYHGVKAGNTDFDREQKEIGNTIANMDYYNSVGNNPTRGTAKSRRTARGLGKMYTDQYFAKSRAISTRHHNEMWEEGKPGDAYFGLAHWKPGADDTKYLDEYGGDPGYDYATETRGQQSMLDYIEDNIKRAHKINAIMGKDFAYKNGYQVKTDEDGTTYPFNMNGMKRSGITKHFDQSWQHPAIPYDQWHDTGDGDGYMEPSDEDDRELIAEWDKKK